MRVLAFLMWSSNYFAGFMPEIFLCLFISFFFCFVAGVRYYQKHYTDAEEGTIEPSTNEAAAVLSLIVVMAYVWYIYNGYMEINNLDCAIYIDPTIYLFRLAFGIVFIIFFIYIAVTSITCPRYKFEYYFVLVVAYWGLNLMIISGSFLTLFLSMEIYSIAIYYLLVSKRFSNRNNEAAFKYFMISAASTALFLFSTFLLYYDKGSISYHPLYMLSEIQTLTQNYAYSLIIIALFIKIGAGVFYFWSLDAYEGVSFPILIFLNIFVKPAFIYVIFKLMLFAGPTYDLHELFLCVMLITSAIGALGAVVETGIKRFFIFTSIYNMGFLACFFWNPTPMMYTGFIVFFFIYSINSIGLMLVICTFRDYKRQFWFKDWKEFINLGAQSPPFAFGMVFFLLSMSGLPPFSFFFIKYFLFVKLFNHYYFTVVIFLLLLNLINLFLYIRLVRLILSPNNRQKGDLLRVYLGPVPYIISILTTFNVIFFCFSGYIIDFINLFITKWAL